MCGIFFYCSKKNKNLDKDYLNKALALISHRGPDNFDFLVHKHLNNEIYFGHTRLSMLDLNKNASQPMSNEKLIIIFNGEIFNFKELKEELIYGGYHFKTKTDTEVFLAGYQKWGKNISNKINGFWSALIYDKQKNTLHVSRDRFGIKPLYYYQTKSEIIFSSEIKPILYLLKSCDIDIDYLSQILVYEQENEFNNTLYKDVKVFPISCYANIDLQKNDLLFQKYWVPEKKYNIKNENNAVDLFQEIFEDSIRLRVFSDRPMGLTLSSGIDSTAVAVGIKNLSLNHDIKSFCIDIPGKDFNENNIASLTAKKLDINHIPVHIDFETFTADFKKFCNHQELPVVSMSQMMNWYIHKNISKTDIKGVLNGQGGDEVFLGYERHRIQNSSFNFLIKLLPIALNGSKKTKYSLLDYFLLYSIINFKSLRKFMQHLRASKYLSKDFITNAIYKKNKKLFSNPDIIINEIMEGQISRLLRYDDRTAGAFGLEGRPIFLDHRLIEYSLSLPQNLVFKDGWSKYILRKYLSRNGFNEIAWKKNKFGFSGPDSQLLPLLNYNYELLDKFVPGAFKRANKTKLRDLDKFKIVNLSNILECMEKYLEK